jgi:hypothetical protein
LNLVVNAVQAMSAVADRVRDVLVTTAQAGPNGVLVGVADFGSGSHAEIAGPWQLEVDVVRQTPMSALEIGAAVPRLFQLAAVGRLRAFRRTRLHVEIPLDHTRTRGENAQLEAFHGKLAG